MFSKEIPYISIVAMENAILSSFLSRFPSGCFCNWITTFPPRQRPRLAQVLLTSHDTTRGHYIGASKVANYYDTGSGILKKDLKIEQLPSDVAGIEGATSFQDSSLILAYDTCLGADVGGRSRHFSKIIRLRGHCFAHVS